MVTTLSERKKFNSSLSSSSSPGYGFHFPWRGWRGRWRYPLLIISFSFDTIVSRRHLLLLPDDSSSLSLSLGFFFASTPTMAF